MLVRLWPWVAGVSLGLLIAGPLFAYSHLVKPIIGFLIFALSLLPALAALVFGLLLLLGVGGERQVVSGLLSIAIGMVPLLVVAPGILKGAKLPRINDVTTDLDNPPAITEAAVYPEDFKEQVRAGYPDLKPVMLTETPQQAFAKVEAALAKIPTIKVTRSDPASGVIEGQDVTGLFRFVDDFTVRVSSAGSGTRIDMRSRSRVGKGDFGANADRIRKVFSYL